MNAEKTTVVSRLDALERRVCAFGTMWGVLSGASTLALIAWYVVRHTVYGALAFVTLSYVKGTAVAIGAFFLFIHLYKLGRWMQITRADQLREAQAAKQNNGTSNLKQVVVVEKL